MRINDLNVYPLAPTPATPAAGQTFVDPTFGTTILRVTDVTDGPGPLVSEYGAIWDMFSADSSRFYYINNGSRWTAKLDVVNKKVSAKQALSKNVVAQYWSRSNPNVFYAIEDWQAANIWKFDFLTNAWTLVVDLTTLAPIVKTPNAAWIGSRGMSFDDNRFHIDFGATIGIGIYDVAQKKILGPVTLAQAQAALPGCTAYAWDKSTMDASGTYIISSQTTGTLNGQTSNSAELLCNVVTGAFYPLLFGYGIYGSYPEVHLDFGAAGLANGIMGLPAGPGDGFYPAMIGPVDPNNLSTFLTARRQIGPRVPWGIDSHSSFRDKTGQWATFTYDGAQQASDKEVQPFQPGEIFQLAASSPPDGSLNRRICQAFSNPALANQPYWGVPFASQSQDNRVVGFHSTYNNPRLDVYIAFLDMRTPPPATGMLAGVEFTAAEAQLLKTFALSQLSGKKS